MIFAIFALWLFLPTRSTSTSLSYSQFLSDDGAPGEVGPAGLGCPGCTSSGTLTDGKNFTVVVPPQAGEGLLTTLQDNHVEISAAQSGQSFASEVLIYLIVFGLPIVLFVWLFRRLSKGATSQFQGVLGVGSCGPRSSTPTGPGPRSPTWPVTTGPRPRSSRWSSS